MKRYAIIVAGGSGQRMESTIPKQFLKIKDEVILMKSMKAFFRYDPTIEIILALPKNQTEHWKTLCNQYTFTIKHTIVAGGTTRFHSVKNALQAISGEGIVAIHDGVRPLVSQTTIDNVFEIALTNGNAIPYIDSIDSVRIVTDNSNKPVNRNQIKLIQTPQAFNLKTLTKAYEQNWDDSFTDDASVVEKLGMHINLVPGNKENIKITTKTDIAIAEVLIDYLSE